MKKVGNLFQKVCSFENLLSAAKKAQKGKRFKESTALFNLNLEKELLILQRELLDKSYQPGPYREFYVYERKPRRISAAPYRDRVVHHALCNVIEPVFENTFIYDSYACRKWKGTHKAVERFTSFSRKNKYALKLDIQKYFSSIDHAILFKKIEKKIKDKDVLWLVKKIIDSSRPQEEIVRYFQGDGLFTPFERRKGIPIGNLTSQFFANIYLNDFDHFIKENLGCRFYIRYVDDAVVFGDDKKYLWKIADEVRNYLDRERLKIHPIKRWVLPLSSGIDFLGYNVFQAHRLLRKDTSMRFRRKLMKMRKSYSRGLISRIDVNASVQSWLGHAKHADTYGLRRSFFNDVVFSRDSSLATVFFVAAHGTINRTTSAARTATGTIQTTGTTTTAFVLPNISKPVST